MNDEKLLHPVIVRFEYTCAKRVDRVRRRIHVVEHADHQRQERIPRAVRVNELVRPDGRGEPSVGSGDDRILDQNT